MGFWDKNYGEDLGYRDSKEKANDECIGVICIVGLVIVAIVVLATIIF